MFVEYLFLGFVNALIKNTKLSLQILFDPSTSTVIVNSQNCSLQNFHAIQYY